MGDSDRVYEWEDVYVTAGRISHYMPNQGNEWPFAEELRFTNYGMFGHLRPFGKAPRCVNLWEMDWKRLAGAMSQQFHGAATATGHFEQWWTKSSVDRTGGWDRFMYPGPEMPPMKESARGVKRPCVVEQLIRLKQGAARDYIDWFERKVRPAVRKVGWEPIVWLSAMHSSFIVTMIAAPDWTRVLDLSEAMPQPDPAWQCDVETIALQAWPGSSYLRR